MNQLTNKHIVLGVTGGIAAYKSADLVRRLREVGASVRVVMTRAAQEFITPLTLQAVSSHPVHDDLFDRSAEAAMDHLSLARWADGVVIAPASADLMARLVHGHADDLLTTLCLATKAPIFLAPSMNQAMWKNTLTQKNKQALIACGMQIIGPAEGSQACGDEGPGRMAEPLDIVAALAKSFASGKLAGQRVLITAGPTREAIDPVRFISNKSTGKMGYALAQAALDAGAEVTLVSGPVHLPPPQHANVIFVESANQMFDVVLHEASANDIFIGVAAVADYRPEKSAAQKIPKNAASLSLALIHNPDVIAAVAALKSKRPFVVGFAAETEIEKLSQHARAKLQNKNLDMIVANLVSAKNFNSDENAVTVLWKNKQQEFPRMDKHKLARELITLIAKRNHP